MPHCIYILSGLLHNEARCHCRKELDEEVTISATDYGLFILFFDLFDFFARCNNSDTFITKYILGAPSGHHE